MAQSVKDHDMFGHSVVLNFNQQGDTFKTRLGGFVSIILKIILSTYFCIQAKKMLNNEMDTLTLSQSLTNYEEVGRLSIKETGMIPYLRIVSS